MAPVAPVAEPRDAGCPRARGWRSAGVNAAVVLVSVVFGLAAGEIGLRTASWLAPPDTSSYRRLAGDALLKRRGNPAFPEHDSRGFRNPAALDRADVVLLGDSVTYGAEVAPDETWGHVLATEIGAVEYNMAIPGWGPGQAAFVLPDALALKPKTVLYGFYFGNDVLDTLDAPAPGRRRDPEVSAAEVHLRCRCRRYPRLMGVRGFVRRHSRIYGLVRNLPWNVPPPSDTNDAAAARRWAESDADDEHAFFDDAQWRTVFNVPSAFCALDDSDPRIRDGVEIALSILLAMARDVENAGAAFAVALLPTKESVFAPRVADLDAWEDLAALVAAESRLRDELTDVLRAKGVPVLDLLPPLRAAPEQPYFVGFDTHPNVAGHRAIGLAVARFIQRL